MRLNSALSGRYGNAIIMAWLADCGRQYSLQYFASFNTEHRVLDTQKLCMRVSRTLQQQLSRLCLFYPACNETTC